MSGKVKGTQVKSVKIFVYVIFATKKLNIKKTFFGVFFLMRREEYGYAVELD